MDDFTRSAGGRDSRRSFTSSQRAALFLAADGLCTVCGAELAPGWHADHTDPWSAGGATDVVNGQALCPTCNLKKGARVQTPLREWQERALARLDRSSGDFLAVATPGAGKTTFALAAAQRMLLSEVNQIIVVVPTTHLRRQWAQAGVNFSIQLDPTFENSDGRPARDYNGVVVTYAAVASNPDIYRRLTTPTTLVVLDEVHHAGEDDNLRWGEALKHAFVNARQRILLSGTPFRSDRRAIPFVAYDEDGQCVPGFDYSYGQALNDADVVRPIEFLAWDGEVRWLNAGAVQPPVHLSNASEDDLSRALRAALEPSGDWVRSVLRKADEELSRHRQVMPDAGGLVVAGLQSQARKYAEELHRITGEQPVLAVSEDEGSSEGIERFSRGSSRWIVAVKMVSEGVDIPRLTCGVYATNVRTQMFVRQVVGRFVRKRSAEDELSAALFIPSIEPLLRIATEIEHTVNEALKEEIERVDRNVEARAAQSSFDLFEPHSASEAWHDQTIRSGDAFTDEELAAAAQAAAKVGLGHLSRAEAAAFARELKQGLAASFAQPATPPAPAAPLTLRSDEKKSHRQLIKRLVGRLARLEDVEPKEINTRLMRVFNGRVADATVEELEGRIELLEKWIEAAS